MAFTLQDVFIQFIDINSTPTTLGSQKKNVENGRYGFLVNRERFEQFQGSEEKLLNSKFLIQPFPKNRLEEGETWYRYMQGTENEPERFWPRQVPFYLRLRKNEISLDPTLVGNGRVVKLDAYLLLNALGWSTRLELRLKETMTFADLQTLLAVLKDTHANPFILNGIPISLKGMFTLYKNTLSEDEYAPAKQYVRPEYWNLAFVNIPCLDGELRSIPSIPQIDLISMINILHPEHGEIEFWDDCGKKQIKIPGLTTAVFGEGRTNLSVTGFNTGTFTFMQDAIYDPKLEGQIMCYSRNVCDFTWLYEMWFNYKRQLAAGKPTDEMKTLCAEGVSVIVGMEERIRNDTILSFYRTHQKI